MKDLNNIRPSLEKYLNVVLKDDNCGNKKWYSEIYNKFKEEIKFSDKHLCDNIDNDIMKFFYTNNERNSLKNKYT